MAGDSLVERLRVPTDGDALYDHVFAQRQQTRSDLPRLNLNNTLEFIDEERAEAADRIAALEAMIKLLVSAIEQAPPEVFGVGGGKHEGSTHWWIRDELVTAAHTILEKSAP